MKTFFNHSIKQPKCAGVLSSSPSLWLRLSRSLWLHVPRSRSKFKSAVRGVLIGLGALSKTGKVNGRFVAAFVIMFVLAPLSGFSYNLFDQTRSIQFYEGQHFFDANGVRWDFWYYKNYFFLFVTLAPWIVLSIFLSGSLLTYPADSERGLMIVPGIAFTIGKIMWLTTVNHDTDFYAMPAWQFISVGLLVAVLIYFSFNYLTRRKYHVFDALCVRVVQIIKARKDKLIDEETADSLLLQESEKLRMFNQQY